MPDALELALANAASNMPKGEELHLENLDVIADPSLDEPDPNYPPYVVAPKPPEYSPRDVAFKATFATEKANAYRERMDAEYNARMEYQRRIGDGVFDYIGGLDFKVSEMNASLINLHQKVDSISTTIDTAAQSMPQEPDHKHRSLHEWDDQYLINELVERENDLMPFYYELLKRIGSPELQKLVMSSMQGKNNSMVTLAQLCAALGSIPTQAQYKPVDHTLADAYRQLEEALPPHNKFSRQHREDAITLVEKYKLPIERRDALSDHDFKAYQSFMNELLHRATLMERIPNREAESTKSKAQDPNGFVHIYGQGYVDPRTVPPMRHDGTTDTVWTEPNFGQATEEYIRQDYSATIPSMPPTYNPYFKER